MATSATMRPVGALDAAALMLSTPAATPTSTPPGLTASAPLAAPRGSDAGSREAPVRHAEATHAVRPTKLFIGGISRHTTTKQLRDHFSQYGRVLDCVAMRQPDGRPRGFGYVTLDSPAAAERCLQEPQSIDGRIVDMKPAVPEGSGGISLHGTPATSPKEADANLNLLAGGQASPFYSWPEATGQYDGGMMPWWATGPLMQKTPTGQALDCVDLLSRRSFPASPAGTAPASVFDIAGQRAAAMGSFTSAAAQELSMQEAFDGVLSPSHLLDPMLASDQSAGGTPGMLSASAPEFFPSAPPPTPPTTPSNAASKPTVAAAPLATTKGKTGRARAPLGELTNLTNIVEVDDLLKPFKSPTNNNAGIGEGILSDTSPSAPLLENASGIPKARPKPTGLLLDSDCFDDDDGCYEDPSDEDIDCGAKAAMLLSPPSSSAGGEVRAEEEAASALVADPCSDESLASLNPDAIVPASGPDTPGDDASVAADGEPESDDDDQDGEDSVAATVVDLDSLPSVGSAQHGTGECKRCNFFPKGRCQNGKDCTFCHFPHDKRKPSRQEKRERRAAWLEQQVGQQEKTDATPTSAKGEDIQASLEQVAEPAIAAGFGSQQVSMPQVPPAFHAPAGFPQNQLGALQDEDVYNDETQQTLAYSVFPGLPPIHATKLPGPLPLPVTGTTCMDFVSQTAPALPPGLTPPVWQPEAEASPAASTLLQHVSQMSTTPAFLDHHVHVMQQVATAEPWTAAPLATVPSPTGALPTPVSMCTASTQTADDIMCHRCESGTSNVSASEVPVEKKTKSKNSKAREGRQWTREDLLRLRSGLLEAGQGKGTVLFSTAPISSNC